MSAGSHHPDSSPAPSEWNREGLARRAAGVSDRASTELAGVIADFFLPEDTRLDDRTRAALATTLRGVIGGIEDDIRRHAVRLLTDRELTAQASAMATQSIDVTGRLTRAGVLRDGALIGELIAQVRLALIEAALPLAADDSGSPGLLIRLIDAPDRVVASAAAALLASDSRRRDAWENGGAIVADLPTGLHRRLTWWIAAAVRAGDLDTDRAIVEAVERSLAAYDEDDRAGAVAMKLVAAIGPRRSELPDLLVAALADRRLRLFVALLAQALNLEPEQAQAITLEPAGDLLWLAARSLDLDRSTIARIALALADADPARDIEAFADALDAIAAVAPDDARAALAPMWLHREYRGAIRALAGSPV